MNNSFNFRNTRALMIDMDGVLWRGDVPLPGLSKFFDFLKREAIPFMLATNNSTKHAGQYQQKSAHFGIEIQAGQVLTCVQATVLYLRQRFKNGAAAYVIGHHVLHEAIYNAGFRLLNNTHRPVDFVVVGADPTLTYDKLKEATLFIQRGARLIATNPDLLVPTEDGLVPDTGATLAALQAVTGASPTIIGKPEPPLFKMAIKAMGSTPGQTAMLGDRLDTDILGGQRAGLKTILVTTGVDNQRTIPQKGIYPDAVFSGLDELVEVWQRSRGDF